MHRLKIVVTIAFLLLPGNLLAAPAWQSVGKVSASKCCRTAWSWVQARPMSAFKHWPQT